MAYWAVLVMILCLGQDCPAHNAIVCDDLELFTFPRLIVASYLVRITDLRSRNVADASPPAPAPHRMLPYEPSYRTISSPQTYSVDATARAKEFISLAPLMPLTLRR